MQILNKQAKIIIEDYIRTCYPKIKVEAGELSLMNCECHNNAYHYAKKENQQIFLCLVKNTEKWIVHWINKKDDKFIDNTLGHFNEQSEYRLIREVSMFEFDRDLNLEESTYSKFVEEHGNDYVLYHGLNDGVISSIKDKHPTSKFVDLDKTTNTFFDYIKILENSKEIHLLDSVWGAFVYQIDAKYGLFKNIPITSHCLRGFTTMFTEPIKLNNWIIK